MKAYWIVVMRRPIPFVNNLDEVDALVPLYKTVEEAKAAQLAYFGQDDKWTPTKRAYSRVVAVTLED